jgi:hypothetical protein
LGKYGGVVWARATKTRGSVYRKPVGVPAVYVRVTQMPLVIIAACTRCPSSVARPRQPGALRLRFPPPTEAQKPDERRDAIRQLEDERGELAVVEPSPRAGNAEAGSPSCFSEWPTR